MATVPPTHICIGAPRSGTTWLFGNLRHSDAIFVPCIKEVRYWWGARSEAEKREALAEQRLLCRDDPAQLDWLNQWEHLEDHSGSNYLKLMGWSARPSLDISPVYSTMPPEQIVNLREALPDNSRIFAILRNPLDRNASVIRLHGYMHGRFRGPMADATMLRFLDRWIQKRHRDYVKTVQFWRNVFGERFRVFYHEDLIADPDGFLRRILDFLGLSGAVDIDPGLAREFYNTNLEQGRRRAVMLTPVQTRLLARLSLIDANAFTEIDPGRAAAWMEYIRPQCGGSTAPPQVPAEADPVGDLLRMSEGLGETCDFPMFQRSLGYEPASLLRWSQSPISAVTAFLETSETDALVFRPDLAGPDSAAEPQTPLAGAGASALLKARFFSQLNWKPGLYVVTTRKELSDAQLNRLCSRLWAYNRQHKVLLVSDGPASTLRSGPDGVYHARLPLPGDGSFGPGWQKLFANLLQQDDIRAMVDRMLT